MSIADDSVDEPPESFSIALVNPVSGATVVIQPDVITITIIDNDEPPTGRYYCTKPLNMGRQIGLATLLLHETSEYR